MVMNLLNSALVSFGSPDTVVISLPVFMPDSREVPDHWILECWH
jgi:hypothetical protein